MGTMHRFKGLEYQKLAVIGASDGILPRTAVVEKYETTDPKRYERELKKSRNQLFVATTRARDALRILARQTEPIPTRVDRGDSVLLRPSPRMRGGGGGLHETWTAETRKARCLQRLGAGGSATWAAAQSRPSPFRCWTSWDCPRAAD
ncbi:3'-5' exonuclease [Streptomyces bobili]